MTKIVFARMTFCDEVCYRNWEKAHILSHLTVEFIGWPPDYIYNIDDHRRKLHHIAYGMRYSPAPTTQIHLWKNVVSSSVLSVRSLSLACYFVSFRAKPTALPP